jgi:hypothetical protein
MSDIQLPPEIANEPGNALNFSRPDIEYWVWQNVRGLGDIVCWTIGTSEVDPHGWASVSSIQVDAKARNRDRASTIADQARRIIKSLPWTEWDGGVIGAVDCTDGPLWQPDQNGTPRYVARYSITYHPKQVA